MVIKNFKVFFVIGRKESLFFFLDSSLLDKIGMSQDSPLHCLSFS